MIGSCLKLSDILKLFYLHSVTNASTWNPPEEFKALYEAHELGSGDEIGRLDGRGTVYFSGIELENGGNFSQALRDNLKEQNLYKNIVKDFIETYALKTVGWFGLNVLLYGGTMFYDGFGLRKKRDLTQPQDYFGGVNQALEESQVVLLQLHKTKMVRMLRPQRA